MKTCYNHSDKKAASLCRGCGKDYCMLCLDEGMEFYYCKEPECQKLLQEELSFMCPANVVCPNCKAELELSDEERRKGKLHCPGCDLYIDFSADPPEIKHKENYTGLLASYYQGDIAIIKSILNDAGIGFFIYGENFSFIDPLIQPARLFVKDAQIEEAKELLKNVDIHFIGTSTKTFEEEEN